MKKQHLLLQDNDRQILESELSNRSLTVKIYKRVEALLLLDSGKTFCTVSAQAGLSFPTLKRLCSRYSIQQLGCLNDAPKPGRPPKITGDERAKLTALACSRAPEGHARWSLRLLSDKMVELELCDAVSHTHVGTILKKTPFNLISNANGVSAL